MHDYSLIYQPQVIRSTFIDLNPDKFNQGLCYYPFMVNIGRCIRNYDTFHDPSGRICVPYKSENVNIILTNIITKTN